MENISPIVEKLRTNRWHIAKTSACERIKKLKKLRVTVLKNRSLLYASLQNDFKKDHVETELTEIQPVIAELNFHIKNLKRWMKYHKVKTPMRLMGTKNYICYEPKGVVAIISPWNYPFHLAIVPLVSAVAAGNCVVLKPSEITGHTSKLIATIIAEVFPINEVIVIEGDASVAKKLLEEKFDHIFFTGSSKTGKLVMEAAAKHLSSVTLELGGKTPAIVDKSASIKSSAERIMWGKFMNAGQTCVAPDYVCVHESIHDVFIEESIKIIKRFYGECLSEQKMCSIVNNAHWNRLVKLLKNLENEKIKIGAKYNDQSKYISPTIISNVNIESKIMQEEIFGPILPIISYKETEEIVSFIQNDKPLSMYIFSKNKKNIQHILQNTTAGGSCINNVAVYLGNPYLPFGGANTSGLGNYHGFFGFQAFSQTRAISYQGIFCGLSFIYPPYTNVTKKLAQWVTNTLS